MKPTTQLLLAGCALLCSACSGGARTKSAEADTTSRIEASSQTAVATTQSGKVAGYAAGNLYVFKGHTLRPRRAVHAAAGSREVGGHTQQPRIRADMSAGRARRLAERRALVRIRLGRRTSRRGLSEGQHLDSGAGRRQEAPRHGLAARRRLRCGQRAGAPPRTTAPTSPARAMRWS